MLILRCIKLLVILTNKQTESEYLFKTHAVVREVICLVIYSLELKQPKYKEYIRFNVIMNI